MPNQERDTLLHVFSALTPRVSCSLVLGSECSRARSAFSPPVKTREGDDCSGKRALPTHSHPCRDELRPEI